MSAVAIPSPRPTRSLRAQAPRDLLYVATSAALGLVWLIALVVLTIVGLSLTLVLFIGVPILVFTLELARWGANTERERAALVLTGPIPRPPRRRIGDGRGGILGETRRRLSDRDAWKDFGYMALLGPVGILAGGITIALWSAVVACVLAPAMSAAAPSGSVLARARATARSPSWCLT